MRRVPPHADGFRRAVVDEALVEDGTLVYVVRLYFPNGHLSVTRTYAAYAAAAKEVFDWMDWSERVPPRLT
ncbi:hypothetical protein [Stenotrophomonas muris]|uniref:hypothetical protein n=1 Tax=Stenotrophomonas muris TaxID=2963283 RepID=UPI0039C6CD55